ncbi:MAG TPA: hypothetical protein VES88_08795 [Gemmatimonadaceae bacterium]|nr:hypothetical protein [Gemmatimonadaceae bacterium]
MSDAGDWNMLVKMPDYTLSWFRERLHETIQPVGAWAPFVWILAFAVAVMVGVRAVRLPDQLGISQRQRDVILFALVSLVVGVVGIFVSLDYLSYFTGPWYYLTLLALAAVCIDAVFGAVIHRVPLRPRPVSEPSEDITSVVSAVPVCP